MADIGDTIYSVLAASSDVTAIVGSGIAARLFPDEASEKIGAGVAYAVYRLISDVRDYTMDGDSNLARARMQIDCYGPAGSNASASKAKAKSLAAAVLKALQGYKGQPTPSSVTIQSCFQEGRHSFAVASPMDVNLRSYAYSIDFDIWYAG